MRRIISIFIFYWRYGVLHRFNKVSYLRSIGVRIGNGCDIITKVQDFGSEPWLVELGNDVTLALGTWLITHDGSSRLFRKRFPAMSPFGNRFAPIRILDNCFVGINAIILPGVTVGPDSIVGTGSVVTKDVPPHCVVAGNPARVVCSLDEYVSRYEAKMISIEARDRESLRRELTLKFFGEQR